MKARPPRTDDYHFVAEDGSDVSLTNLFGDHDTLILDSYMFGKQREAPCPMCTSLMGGLDHKIADIRQRVAIHEAENVDAFLEHAHRGGFPANTVSVVASEFGPQTAALAAQ